MKRYRHFPDEGAMTEALDGEWVTAVDVERRLLEIRRLLESSHVRDNQFRLGVLGAQDIRMAIHATYINE